MKNPRVEILIDELVLHGFSPSDRDAIGAALQQELGRLAADGRLGGLAAARDVDVLRAPQAVIAPQARPAVVGAQVARSVFGGLSGVAGEQKK
jgi:hypothetical protein